MVPRARKRAAASRLARTGKCCRRGDGGHGTGSSRRIAAAGRAPRSRRATPALRRAPPARGVASSSAVGSPPLLRLRDELTGGNTVFALTFAGPVPSLTPRHRLAGPGIWLLREHA